MDRPGGPATGRTGAAGAGPGAMGAGGATVTTATCAGGGTVRSAVSRSISAAAAAAPSFAVARAPPFRGSPRAGSRSAASPASAVSRRARSASAVLAGGKVAHVRLGALLAGHKTRTVFDRYAIVSHRDLHTAVTLLEGVASSLDPHSAHHGERGSTTGHGRTAV